MRKLFPLLVTVVMLALVASCSDKDDINGPDTSEGEGNVQLRISDSMGGTKAYGGTEDPEPGESNLASTLAVFVFPENGGLEYVNLNLPVNTTTGVTNTFKLGEGIKYMYIFSNGDIPSDITTGSSRDDLEKAVRRVKFDNPAQIPDPIAISEHMTIGTLWGSDDPNSQFCNRIDIQDNGFLGEPQHVKLSVGRAAAKVRLLSVDKQQPAPATPSPLTGAFDQPTYRLRSLADRYYLVGQLGTAGTYPPTTGLRYISAVHELGPGTTLLPNDAFGDYGWENEKVPGASAHFYAVENTTKKMTSENVTTENLYYGNTTYVQLKIRYTPGADEVYDPANPTDDPAAQGLNEGDTFWSAMYGTGGATKERRIFSAAPPADNADFEDIQQYEGGVMYYHFPIRDKTESAVELQCCVIRNHYYEIAVKNILGVGKGTDDVDREEPIEDTDVNVDITVNILPWFKVEQEEDLG